METNILMLVIALLLHLAAFIWLVIVAFKRSVPWGLAVFFLSLLLAPIPAIVFAVTNWFDAKKPFLAYLFTMILALVPLMMMGDSVDEEFMMRLNEKVESGEIKENEVVQYIMNPELLDELENKAQDGEIILNENGEPVLDATASGSESKEEWEDIKPVVVDPDKVPADKKTGDTKLEDKKSDDKAQKEEPVEKEPLPYPRAGEVKPDPLAIKRKDEPKESVRVSLSKIANYKGRYFVVTKKDGTQHRGILAKITKSRIVLERKIYGGTFTYRILRTKIKQLDMLKKEYVDDGS